MAHMVRDMTTHTVTNGEEKRAAAKMLLSEGKTTREVRAEIRAAFGTGLAPADMAPIRAELGLPPGATTGITKSKRPKRKGSTTAEREALLAEYLRRGWSTARAKRSVRHQLGAAPNNVRASELARLHNGTTASAPKMTPPPVERTSPALPATAEVAAALLDAKCPFVFDGVRIRLSKLS